MERKQDALNLYTIDKDYVNYLRKFDNKVSINHGDHTRPFVGIIYSYEEVNYFIPLSSKKKKFINMRNNNISIVKLKDGNLGCALLNNMIPVPRGQYQLIDIDNLSNKNYQKLLRKQAIEINTKKFKEELASKFNKLIVDQKYKKPFLKKICCDYELLHTKAKDYNKK